MMVQGLNVNVGWKGSTMRADGLKNGRALELESSCKKQYGMDRGTGMEQIILEGED